MNRRVALIGAPSNIGIRPYDDGEPRHVDLAPAALREQGLVERLAARDWGDVEAPPYRDRVRRGLQPRNESDVVAYSRALAGRLAAAAASGDFVLVLGGDCSIVLGCLLGARRPGGPTPGLAYLDAHADFGTPQESRTGSVASMCLALAVGRGDTPLARLGGSEPLARAEVVALIGRRDHAEPWYGHAALRASPVLDLADAAVRKAGPATIAARALARLARPGVGGFWIHLDADLLDPRVLPAVDSPVAGGLEIDEVAELLSRLAHHPCALGLELTIYDPSLDRERTSAARLAALLERALE